MNILTIIIINALIVFILAIAFVIGFLVGSQKKITKTNMLKVFKLNPKGKVIRPYDIQKDQQVKAEQEAIKNKLPHND